MGKVMLALSTFRQSERAVELAIEKASEGGKALIVAFVVDVNLARYLIGSDVGLFPELKERCEEELLKEHREQAEEEVGSVVKAAEGRGITVEAHVSTGRFALECLKVIDRERPDVVVTTRSRRAGWVRRFFGSPVDHLIARAGCPVLES